MGEIASKLMVAAVLTVNLATTAIAQDASNKTLEIKAGLTGVVWDDQNHGAYVNGSLVPG